MRKILFAIGMLLLFGSWIAQNYNESKWTNQLEWLEHIQTRIMEHEKMRDIWMIEHNTRDTSEPRDLKPRAFAALRMSKRTLHIMTWITAVNKTYEIDATVLLNRKNRFDELQTLFDNNKYEELIEKNKLIIKEHNSQLTPSVVNGLNKKLATVRNRKDKWNFIFLWSYIIGTVLLGISWVMKQREPSLNLGNDTPAEAKSA